MTFFSAKSKYKKHFKGRFKCNAKSRSVLTTGYFGLKAMESYRITAQQIEAVRKTVSKSMKKLKVKCSVKINIYPDSPVTKKPIDVRMGKGKGNVEFWVARVRAGTIMFEIDEVEDEGKAIVLDSLRRASAKLPISCRIVTADNFLR